MKQLAAAALLVLMTLGASSLAAGPTQSGHDPAQSFSLRVGESAQVCSTLALRVGFEAVTADSRCPRGAQCIWAGDATARLWLQRATEPRQTLELKTGASSAPLPSSLGLPELELRLMRLTPEPVVAKAIAAGDYVVTLTMSRSTAVD